MSTPTQNSQPCQLAAFLLRFPRQYKNMPENQPNSEDSNKKHLTRLKTVNIALEFGFIVVIPLLAFGYLGKWLDGKYDKNYFVLIGIVLAMVVTTVWFYKTIKKLMEQMKNL